MGNCHLNKVNGLCKIINDLYICRYEKNYDLDIRDYNGAFLPWLTVSSGELY